ncbi:MAG: phage holin family protein [Proteobacteria bacterium]|nr:phage holin family protein [Pseudomonadota bacterium]
MNHISRSLTTIYRTERLIARRSLAVFQNQIVFVALACVAALIGLILVNVSLFFVLETYMSQAAASGILAVGNIIFAGLLAAVAGRMSVEKEIAPAVEVRDMAIEDLEADVEAATREVREIANSLKGIGRDPLGSLSTLILPLITMLLKKG